jgi:hypothetical protein
MELAGKSQTEKSPQEISQLIHKVGTNRLLSRKTVSFSFAEPYDFAASLLASVEASPSTTRPSLRDETSQRIKWCSHPESNRDQPFRRRRLYPLELWEQLIAAKIAVAKLCYKFIGWWFACSVCQFFDIQIKVSESVE